MPFLYKIVERIAPKNKANQRGWHNMQHYSIAIIGMGSRGLSVLERFAARLNSNPIDAALTVHVIDPGLAGEGIHKASQPDHLVTNTTAASITAYCDRSVAGVKALLNGPSFHEWLTTSGSRFYGEAFGTSASGGKVTGDCFPPRCVLGEYLQWAYQDIVRRLPPNVLVEHHGCTATDVCEMEDGSLKVRLGQGEIFADFVYLTTGHAGSGPDELDELWSDWSTDGRRRNGKARYFPSPYPLEAIDAVAPESKVAICGTGLTAIDIVSMLTAGRGGRFVSNAAGFSSYVPSGREPRIALFSRQGLPPCGKPMPQKGSGWPYTAKFFTQDFIDKQRSRTRNGQLDWSRDLYPTLRKEMAYVWRCTERGAWLDPADFEIDAELSLALERLLAPLSRAKFVDQADYQAFLTRYIRDDVVACDRGKLADPGKAVTEMIRDVQDNIRYAVDYAGLTPASHADFLQNWCSISNRIAAGPPKERNVELLALIEAGIVSFFGPAPLVEFDSSSGRYCLVSTGFGEKYAEWFDVLFRAKVEVFHPEASSDALFRNMIASGVCVPFANGDFRPGGIAIDRSLNVIRRNGLSAENIWALGYVVEGAHYYTYVLPCPGSNSRAFRDADRIVGLALAKMESASATRRTHRMGVTAD